MTLSTQFETFGWMMVAGAIIGMNLDVYHRLLHSSITKLKRSFLDIFFWVVQAAVVFYMLLLVNHGEIRIYFLLAIALGAYMYRKTFRRVFTNTLEVIIRFVISVCRVFKWFFQFVFLIPLKTVLKLFYRSGMIGLTTFRTILLTTSRFFLAPVFRILKRSTRKVLARFPNLEFQLFNLREKFKIIIRTFWPRKRKGDE
ncbi:spore cortex biosynthesis protein YabQ [Salsuginibacillus kocurii]|uniref:spore cortex biosynthesis protein YabQ n=1 Tax=Salsuginibacillus kocurii TaxID=427078 RepID=UPI0003669081|nr:spore cortex biosynthesis protein YabQ [Salsuginibacillus kocurii]